MTDDTPPIPSGWTRIVVNMGELTNRLDVPSDRLDACVDDFECSFSMPLRTYRNTLIGDNAVGGIARQAATSGYNVTAGQAALWLFLDILSMYQEMNDCYEKLDDKSGIDQRDLKFPGFDGNNEAELLAYARYYVEDLGRFSRLGITYLNSHSPVIEMYQRMLEEYRKVQYTVKKDDVIRILAARIHPDNR
jgi:hypothetical protein